MDFTVLEWQEALNLGREGSKHFSPSVFLEFWQG